MRLPSLAILTALLMTQPAASTPAHAQSHPDPRVEAARAKLLPPCVWKYREANPRGKASNLPEACKIELGQWNRAPEMGSAQRPAPYQSSTADDFEPAPSRSPAPAAKSSWQQTSEDINRMARDLYARKAAEKAAARSQYSNTTGDN